jgi:hypothetical protein
MALAAASALAQDWGNLATISSTLGVNANRLCLGEGLRASDIGCPSYAPYVTSGSLVGISTTNPGNLLDIRTGVSGQGLRLTRTAGSSWDFNAYSTSLQLQEVGYAPRMTFLAGGNVGIGTGSPQATLHVSGTFIVSNITQVTTPSIYVSTGLGYVGIGTNTPSYPLDVAGTARAAGAILSWINGTSGDAGLYMTIGQSTFYNSVANTAKVLITPASNDWSGSSATIKLQASGTSFITGGNVGIGTQTPTVALEVSGTISATNFVGNGSGLTGVTAGAAGVSGSIQFKSGGALAGRSDIVISDTGSVGIGTANPSFTLTVAPTGGAGSATVYVQDQTPSTGQTLVIIRQGAMTSSTYGPFRLENSAGTVLAGYDQTNNAWSAPSYRIGNGAGGMWTTAGLYVPGNALLAWSATNNATATKDIGFSRFGVGILGVGNGTTSDTSGRILAATMGLGTQSPTATLQVSGSMIVSVTGQTTTPTLYAGTNGRVGIGTNAPNTNLGVYGSGIVYSRVESADAQANFSLRGTFGQIENILGDFYLTNDASTGNMVLRTSGTERVRIAPGGNVGISNTSPIAKLDVNGTISASDAIQVSGSALACASSINGAMRWSATSDTLQICTGSGWKSLTSSTTAGGGGSPGGVSGSIQFNGGGSLAGRSDIVIDNAGQVAIGTSNPSATLEVSGTLKLAGGTGAEVCDPDHYGQIRRNPTTGAFQICVNR